MIQDKAQYFTSKESIWAKMKDMQHERNTWQPNRLTAFSCDQIHPAKMA
jgi:hypothetical protein